VQLRCKKLLVQLDLPRIYTEELDEQLLAPDEAGNRALSIRPMMYRSAAVLSVIL